MATKKRATLPTPTKSKPVDPARWLEIARAVARERTKQVAQETGVTPSILTMNQPVATTSTQATTPAAKQTTKPVASTSKQKLDTLPTSTIETSSSTPAKESTVMPSPSLPRAAQKAKANKSKGKQKQDDNDKDQVDQLVTVPVSVVKTKKTKKDKSLVDKVVNVDTVQTQQPQAPSSPSATTGLTLEEIEAARRQRRREKKQRKFDAKAKTDSAKGSIEDAPTATARADGMVIDGDENEENRRKKEKKKAKKLEKRRLKQQQQEEQVTEPSRQQDNVAGSLNTQQVNTKDSSKPASQPATPAQITNETNAVKKDKKSKRRKSQAVAEDQSIALQPTSPAAVPVASSTQPVAKTSATAESSKAQTQVSTPVTAASPPRAASQAGKKRKRSSAEAVEDRDSNTSAASSPQRPAVASPAPVSKKRKVHIPTPAPAQQLQAKLKAKAKAKASVAQTPAAIASGAVANTSAMPHVDPFYSSVVHSLQQANPTAFTSPWSPVVQSVLQVFLHEMRGTGNQLLESGPLYEVVKDLCRKGLGDKLEKMIQAARREIMTERSASTPRTEGAIESGIEADVESAAEPALDVNNKSKSVIDKTAKKATKRERQQAVQKQKQCATEEAATTQSEAEPVDSDAVEPELATGDVSMADAAPSSPSNTTNGEKRRRMRLGKREKAQLRAFASGDSSRQSSVPASSQPQSPVASGLAPAAPIILPATNVVPDSAAEEEDGDDDVHAQSVVPESPARAPATPINDMDMDVEEQETKTAANDKPQTVAVDESNSDKEEPETPTTPRQRRQSSEAQATSDADSEIVAALLSPRRPARKVPLPNDNPTDLAATSAGVEDTSNASDDASDDEAAGQPNNEAIIRPQDIPLPPSPSPEAEDALPHPQQPLKTIGQRDDDGDSSSSSDSDSESSSDDDKPAPSATARSKRRSLYAVATAAFDTPDAARRRPRVSLPAILSNGSELCHPLTQSANAASYDDDDEIDQLLSQTQNAPSARQIFEQAEKGVMNDSGSDRSSPPPASRESSPEVVTKPKSPIKKSARSDEDEPPTEDDEMIARPATNQVDDEDVPMAVLAPIAGVVEAATEERHDEAEEEAAQDANDTVVLEREPDAGDDNVRPSSAAQPVENHKSDDTTSQPLPAPHKLTDIDAASSSQAPESHVFDVDEDNTQSQDAFKSIRSSPRKRGDRPVLFLPPSQSQIFDHESEEADELQSSLNTPVSNEGGLAVGNDVSKLSARASPGPMTRAAARAASRSPAPEHAPRSNSAVNGPISGKEVSTSPIVKDKVNGSQPIRPSASQNSITTTRSGRTSLPRFPASQPNTSTLVNGVASKSTAFNTTAPGGSRRASSLRGLSQLEELVESATPRRKVTKVASASQGSQSTAKKGKVTRQWVSQGGVNEDDDDDDDDNESDKEDAVKGRSASKLW
ncbi:hypothetical protein OIO90_005870 [Microbotryomycetes sp. JL221]|nr:hypothetical protein OIO90_005870 [Microbotryomycetes sp. JL221]